MKFKTHILLLPLGIIFVLWMGCRTTGSNSVSKQEEVTEHNEHASHSTPLHTSASTPATSERQSAPLLEAKQAHRWRLQNEYMCPNGLKEQEKYPFYSINEHEAFLLDVQNLDKTRVVLELRGGWSQFCNFDGGWDGGSCSGPVITKPLLVVPVEPPQHGFSVINLVLENLDDMKPSQLAKCSTQEKYEKSPVVRFVLDLNVFIETSPTNGLIVHVNAVIQ